MRYLAFAFDQYYPTGGWEDYVGSADSINDAQVIAMSHGRDWWHVVDLETAQVVAQGHM